MLRSDPMKLKTVLILLLVVKCVGLAPLLAQTGMFNHPEVNWQIIETEHFKIFADKGLIDVARDVAQIAEEIFHPVTEDLGYVPNFKVPLVLIDFDEEFNGSAEPLFGKMVIYCSSGTKVTSGNLSWLRRVIAHEFSHIITFGAIGAFDAFTQRYQALGALQIIPIWFLEGIAQYVAETWDTHRDMLLRMVTLEGNLLPLSKMEGFAGTDIRESRLIYEQGHSLVRYIANNYGSDKIKEILAELKKAPFSLSVAIKKVLREELNVIHEKWLSFIKEKYTGVKKETQPYYNFALRLTNMGGWVWHPVFSPQGNRVLFASSYNYDYATCDLYMGELKDNRLVNVKKITDRAGFFHSFSTDGSRILFSKIDYRKNGSLNEDIYIISPTGHNRRRLTYNERAKHPSFSTDGKKIAYVVNKFGVTDIWIMDADGKNKVNLTKGKNYGQNDSPRWSRDGRFIAFSHFSDEKRDIAIFDLESKNFHKLTDDEFDDRTPVFMPDGKGILFTSDRIRGIPNLFLMKINKDDSGVLSPTEIFQLTDIVGGVFEPEIDTAGNRILFSGFGAKGFDLYLCELDRLSPVSLECKNQGSESITQITTVETEVISQPYSYFDTPPTFNSRETRFLSEAKGSYCDTPPTFNSRETRFLSEAKGSYNSFLGIRPIFLLPAITISNYGLWGTIGMYFLDPLDKHTISGYAYFDGFNSVFSWSYTNRQLYPTIIFSGYQNPYYYTGARIYRRYRANNIEVKFPLSGHFSLSGLALFQTSEDALFDTNGYKLGQVDKNENNLGIACSYLTYRERVDSDFNPAGGRYINLSYLWSNPAIGSNYDYHLYKIDWREYIDIWRRGAHTLAVRFYGRAIETNQGHTISLPWDDNTLRGIPWGALRGNRTVASSIEYRFPLFKDLGFNFLGLYFDRFYIVPFVDYGGAWYGNEIMSGKFRSTFGAEARFRFWIMSRYPMILRLGLLQEIEPNNQAGWLFSIQPTF